GAPAARARAGDPHRRRGAGPHHPAAHRSLAHPGASMSAITTHVLDTALGRPAGGVPIALERLADGGGWEALGQGLTDGDGRLRTLLPAGAPLQSGTYRISFDTRVYFAASG